MVEAALPPGVSMGTAQSVLFIGKAVRVLQRPSLSGNIPCLPPCFDFVPCHSALQWPALAVPK